MAPARSYQLDGALGDIVQCLAQTHTESKNTIKPLESSLIMPKFGSQG